MVIFNGPETRINVGGSRHLMAVRNESEANFTTTSFIEGDVLLTVHIADADADVATKKNVKKQGQWLMIYDGQRL